MKQPTNIQKGFLFDYKWIPTLRDLEPRDFYILFWQLLDFQQSNGSKKVPRHRGRKDLDHIVNLIVPQIENRLNGALGGRPPQRLSPQEGGSNPGSTPPLEGGMEGGLGAKISQDKISQDKLSQAKSPAPGGTHAHGGTHASDWAETAPHGANAATRAAAAIGGTQKSEKYPRRGTPYTRQYSRGGDQGSTATFDVDSFFEDAVRHSLGDV